MNRYGSDLSFEFSHYTYTPRTIADERSIFLVRGEELLSEVQIGGLLRSAPKGQELALHSRVHFSDGTVQHIPMVDLSAPATGVLTRVLAVLPDEIANSMLWFESGRSHHGYGQLLVNHDDWIRIMGRLLLVNQPQMPTIVDPRWIGHRLLAGYSALRWTKNTAHYIQQPKLSTQSHLIAKPNRTAIGKTTP